MKKKVILLLITTLLLQSFAVFAKDYPQKFWDVQKDHWAFEYIADLADRGVIKGYDDGSFKPGATVSRAEWAKMMCVAANLVSTDKAVYFTDTKGHWANTYINAAKKYITSYSDGSFRPEQAIVREDVTRSLVTLRGYDTSNVDYSYITGFKDFDSISNFMKAYVAVAVENGLINGFEDNTFRGQGTLTRAMLDDNIPIDDGTDDFYDETIKIIFQIINDVYGCHCCLHSYMYKFHHKLLLLDPHPFVSTVLEYY